MIAASLSVLTPASGASRSPFVRPVPSKLADARRIRAASHSAIGSYTPAATDARLAAVLSRSGLVSTGFRFTPASSIHLNRSVTVAVRARTNHQAYAGSQSAMVAPVASSLAPVAYNLGLAVGWHKFALLGDIERVDLAGLGRHDALDVGLSFAARRFSTRLQLGADRVSGTGARLVDGGDSYTADLGTSYSLTRNFDVTAGVRYRAELDRAELDRLVPPADTRRDSQAVYVGTAFRF